MTAVPKTTLAPGQLVKATPECTAKSLVGGGSPTWIRTILLKTKLNDASPSAQPYPLVLKNEVYFIEYFAASLFECVLVK